ncbi:MAG: arylamine N-acetyltransferase, partial [Planctomycetes bacterium]|nr:arylamine N-acetyltransferase [Planctomycetota bacterium]
MTAADRAAVRAALMSTDLAGSDGALERLARIARDFARFPYENLTKILACARTGEPERRLPAEVMADHERWGAGGTCFALTHFFGRILGAAGFEPELLFADRSYAQDAHTALSVTVSGGGGGG